MSKINEAIEWLSIAKSNLQIASAFSKSKPRDIRYEDLCFELQQCVEKSLKSLLIYKGVKISKTHSIGFVIEQVLKTGIKLPAEVVESARLTTYSVETRYPCDNYKISKKEFLSVLKTARYVYDWVRNYFNSLY
ncbi:MAG: HEPN domain-containing protein [Oligoflexia bacterium]|nr:HEPN domain-containing protein [Oligoflexia bacterium]